MRPLKFNIGDVVEIKLCNDCTDNPRGMPGKHISVDDDLIGLKAIVCKAENMVLYVVLTIEGHEYELHEDEMILCQ